jgi:signal transduction histidine kinase
VTTETDQELIPVRWAGLSNVLSLFGLGLLAFGASAEVGHLNHGAGRVAGVVLLVIASVSWIFGLVLHQNDSRPSATALGVMAVTGGALVAFAPVAMVFPAVAALSTVIRWRPQAGVLVGVCGWLATVVTGLAAGSSLSLILGCLAAIFGGTLIGYARKQGVEQADQLARMEVERVRAEVQQERAEMLTERNHMAREIHDVLAHTLAALSLQLEAFGTIVDSEPHTSPAVRDQLERTRQLVREGLKEASGAVRALRDDSTSLDEQLARVCDQQQVDFSVSGQPHPLSPRVVVGLYRTAQEALTNVMKHATGASTSVQLDYGGDEVSVVIRNASAPASPALDGSGSGYGLQGIAERLALLGGSMEAGPTPEGWQVRATVPAVAVASLEGGDG